MWCLVLRRVYFCYLVAGTWEHPPASSPCSCPLSIERLLDSHHTVASANSLRAVAYSHSFGRGSFAAAFDVDRVSEGEILNSFRLAALGVAPRIGSC